VPEGRAHEGRKRSRAELIATQVEDEILAARLPVGAHLGRRAEFMDRFRVSPTIMNETLRILRSRGLVGVRPGTGGGIFVASLPPQIRLGAMDLWFHESSTHPLDLFEARVHLEGRLTEIAFVRATDDDVADLQVHVEQLEAARNARAYLDAVMRLHRVLVRAAKVPVLDGMHQSVVALLQATLSRAEFIDGYEQTLRHSIDIHAGLVDAIAARDRVAFDKIVRLHDADLVRADDPRRSPDVGHD
jgi:DNA-binding FadR family transcriptional regulator